MANNLGMSQFSANPTYPAAYAGPDDSTAASSYVLASATAKHYTSLLWTIDSGNGSFFPSASVLNPTYTPAPDQAGVTQYLKLSVTGPGGTNASWMNLTLVAPTVQAGSDQAAVYPASGTVSADASVDYYVSLQWTIEGPLPGTIMPGTILFPNAVNLLAPPPGPGSPMICRLTATGYWGNASDTLTMMWS